MPTLRGTLRGRGVSKEELVGRAAGLLFLGGLIINKLEGDPSNIRVRVPQVPISLRSLFQIHTLRGRSVSKGGRMNLTPSKPSRWRPAGGLLFLGGIKRPRNLEGDGGVIQTPPPPF